MECKLQTLNVQFKEFDFFGQECFFITFQFQKGCIQTIDLPYPLRYVYSRLDSVRGLKAYLLRENKWELRALCCG